VYSSFGTNSVKPWPLRSSRLNDLVRSGSMGYSLGFPPKLENLSLAYGYDLYVAFDSLNALSNSIYLYFSFSSYVFTFVILLPN